VKIKIQQHTLDIVQIFVVCSKQKNQFHTRYFSSRRLCNTDI